MLIAVIVGAVAGGLVGYERAKHQLDNYHGLFCEGGPPLELIFTPAIYGAGGALLGAAVGWAPPHSK